MKRHSSQSRLLSLLWLVAGSPPLLLAHDIPQRFFDRGVQVTIEPQRLHVVYQLSVSRLTMAEELLSLVGAGGLSGAGDNDRFKLYASQMGPLLASGLVIQLDDQPLELSVIRTSHVVEDHPRFQFEFAAAMAVSAAEAHRLRLEDTSFFLEKGRVRIAIHAAPPGKLQSSSVPAQLDEVVLKSAWEMTPEQQDAARRAEARWTSDAETINPIDAPVAQAVSANDPDMGGAVHRMHDLTELLDRWPNGFYAGLLGLAFFFGAAHAMTPGHGKTMVAAYLVGERGTMGHAVALGLTTSMTHTSSVLVVALLLRLVGHELQDKLNMGFALLSGLLVAVLGGCLLLARIRARLHYRSCDSSGVSGEASGCGNETGGCEAARGPRWSGLLTLGISGGVVPCPDAIVLLLIATAQGQVESAVFLLLSFSAGLASALVLVGIMAVRLRGFLTSRMGSGGLVQSLPLVSAAAIFAVGLYLCIITLQQPLGIHSLMTPAATRTAGP